MRTFEDLKADAERAVRALSERIHEQTKPNEAFARWVIYGNDKPVLVADYARPYESARLADAIEAWQNANVPTPEIVLLAPDQIERLVREMERQTGRARSLRDTRCNVLGIEMSPDARLPNGVRVFVDRDFKFLGAVAF